MFGKTGRFASENVTLQLIHGEYPRYYMVLMLAAK